MKLQEIKFGEHTLFSNTDLIDAVIVNSYRYAMYQTSSPEVAHRFIAYLTNTYPNITTQDIKGVVSARFLTLTCDQVRDQV